MDGGIIERPTAMFFRVGELEISRDARLIKASWGASGGTVLNCIGGRSVFAIDENAVMLDQVAARRAPLLWRHNWDVEHYLGLVQEAWIGSGRLHVVASVGHSALADRLYRDLCSGMPFGCSAGSAIFDSTLRHDAGGPYLEVSRWGLTELSLTFLRGGADQDAEAVADDHAFEMLQLRRTLRAEELEKQLNALDPVAAGRLRGLAPGIVRDVAAALGVQSGADLAAAEHRLRSIFESFSADTRIALGAALPMAGDQ